MRSGTGKPVLPEGTSRGSDRPGTGPRDAHGRSRSPWLIALLAAALVTLDLRAATLVPGEPLPALAIAREGECILDGQATRFQRWDSESLPGRVQVLEYVAARAGVDAIHRPFYQALDEAGLAVPVTKVVNSDDALWGTSGLVVGEIEKAKRETPGVTLVVDAEGLGRSLWQLQERTAALVILDGAGRVVFFREGEMTAGEVEEAIALVRSHLPVSGNGDNAGPRGD